MGGLKGLICGLRDLLHVRVDRMAKRRHGRERLADEDGAAQFPLKRADRVSQRGLRNPDTLSGTGEIALLAQSKEVADLVHLHVCPLSRFITAIPAIGVGYRM
jgi:hypothetical protein